MRIDRFFVVLVAGLMAACAGQSQPKPVEVLDERTAMTIASLQQPIELEPNLQQAVVAFGKRSSFAYVGPLEWDRMGTIGYGLWVHIAPGNERQPVDIRATGAVILVLDDESFTLSSIEVPELGHEPYKAVVPWGQTAYFTLDVEMLKKIAASKKLELDVRATDASSLSFFPSYDTRPALTEYVRGRGITGD